jgi:hypothetical protein
MDKKFLTVEYSLSRFGEIDRRFHFHLAFLK